MGRHPDEPIHAALDALYRAESGRILATLLRLLGDFDLAEDAMHDAFAAALGRWPTEGIPANPRAWLVSTGRFKAIDGLRRRERLDASREKIIDQLGRQPNASEAAEEEGLPDDCLRLIFTCCHPLLAAEARVALTLREVCGLTTEEIARAFLMGAPTLAQRIVRAKAKIREAGIPFQVPSPAELPARLEAVLQVIYLVFNEGYSASSGQTLTRVDLSVEGALRSRRFGAYTLQAAIAAVHAEAATSAATDWAQIVALYGKLAEAAPSPVVELNRAVAMAMRDGPETGLKLIDFLLARGELKNYPWAHSARADLCRRLGRTAEARASYEEALAHTRQEPGRRFLQTRLQTLS